MTRSRGGGGGKKKGNHGAWNRREPDNGDWNPGPCRWSFLQVSETANPARATRRSRPPRMAINEAKIWRGPAAAGLDLGGGFDPGSGMEQREVLGGDYGGGGRC
jgi:hypothetical protein